MAKRKKYRLKAKYRPKNIIKNISKKKRSKRKNKYRVKNKIVIVFILLCLAVFIFSLVHIISWKSDNNSNREIAKEIKKSVVVKDDKYTIDFDKLKKENPDTVGYIRVKNTDINYAVVKTDDNKYYLDHNFKKEYNIAGWIFADYRNKFNGEDKNITIYGHNMRDGSMFGTLKNILDEEWYSNKDNLNVTLLTEKGTLNYEVFSVYKIKKEGYYALNSFKDDKEYEKFIKEMKDRSKVDFKKEVSSDDKILTLSTCARNNNYRVVLHAVLK